MEGRQGLTQSSKPPTSTTPAAICSSRRLPIRSRTFPPTQVSFSPSILTFALVVPSILNVLFLKERNGQAGEHSVGVTSGSCGSEPRPGSLPVGVFPLPSPTWKQDSTFLFFPPKKIYCTVRNWRVASQSSQHSQQKFQLDITSLPAKLLLSHTQCPPP